MTLARVNVVRSFGDEKFNELMQSLYVCVRLSTACLQRDSEHLRLLVAVARSVLAVAAGRRQRPQARVRTASRRTQVHRHSQGSLSERPWRHSALVSC